MELLREVYEKLCKALGTHKNLVNGSYHYFFLFAWNKTFIFHEEFSVAKQNPIPLQSKDARCLSQQGGFLLPQLSFSIR